MTDILLDWQAFGPDIKIENGDLATDDGLVTAVMVSLFTDARADDDVEILDGDRRGWWPDTDEESLGSLLWLIQREKATQEVAASARSYAREALQWMIDDDIAEQVNVTSEYAAPTVLVLTVEIVRGSAQAWQRAWDGVRDQAIEMQGIKFNLLWA